MKAENGLFQVERKEPELVSIDSIIEQEPFVLFDTSAMRVKAGTQAGNWYASYIFPARRFSKFDTDLLQSVHNLLKTFLQLIQSDT